MSTVAETLSIAARALDGHSDSPRLDAELLLGKILELPRSGLITRSNEPVARDSEQAYARLIERREGAPVAYLTGSREFWSLPLLVTPAVLVPRPETELLVELALKHLPRHRSGTPADQACSILDLGTGSGAIALAIASERRMFGSLASISRLRRSMWRFRTRAIWGLRTSIGALGSWFAPVHDGRFDMIVANPPYIASRRSWHSRSLAAEPALALSDGPTGLEALSAIAGGAATHLHPGRLADVGAWQRSGAGCGLLAGKPWLRGIRCYSDFSDKTPRHAGVVHSHKEPT